MKKNKPYIIGIILIALSSIAIVFLWSEYKKEQLSAALHNAGNGAIKEYVQGNDLGLLQALEYYSGSLNILENSQTRYNYDLVQELLTQQEDNKQEEQEPEQPTDEEGESEDTEQGKSSEQENQNGENSPNDSGEDNEKTEELSEEEKEILEQITEQIRNEQNYNQQYYNKGEQESNFQNVFDTFFGEIDRGGEKDW